MLKKLWCFFLLMLTVISLVALSACENQSIIENIDNSNISVSLSSISNSENSQIQSTQNSSADDESVKPLSPITNTLTKQSLAANDGFTLSYWLYTPENAVDNMPLLIYLHGGSGKGDDLDILLQYGFGKFLNDGLLGKIPAYIVIPQVSTGMKGWTDIKNNVKELVNYCCNTYNINSSRVSLTGHSMGGTGTWNLALSFPDLFSCIAPMSGTITTSNENINSLKSMPIWTFVGSEDKIVAPETSIQFIAALENVNRNANITILNDAQHADVPELVFLDEDISIIQWLITQSK